MDILKGIAGIIARRDWLKKQGKTSDKSGKDFVSDLVEAIAKGNIRRETGPLGFKRIEVKHKGLVADLLWHRGRRTFYLTGWDDLTGGLKDILESAGLTVDPYAFVKAPNGSINFGSINKIVAAKINKPEGVIRLQEGDTTFGKAHIIKRMDVIKKAGFSNVEKFVEDIAGGYQAVYQGKGRSLILVKRDSRTKAAYIVLDVSKVESFYSIRSATYIRRSYLKNKKLLWEDANFPHATKSDTPNAVSGQSISERKISRITESVNDDFMPGWAKAIVNAEDIDDVSNLFKVLFKVPTDAKVSPYFKATERSIVMSLDKLVARESANPESLQNAHSRMKKVLSGEGEKRKPLSVIAMGNGKYKILDGTTTLQALKDLGEGKAIVEVKKTLLQPGVETIDDLYSQAEEAMPSFKSFMEEWARKTGGKVSIRPGLKDKDRVLVKTKDDKRQRVSSIKDILAGTLIFDTVQEVSAALRMIETDPSV